MWIWETMKRSESGFTLIEMLISYLIFLLIVCSIPFLFKIIHEWTTPKHHFNQFEWQLFIEQSKIEIKESEALNVTNSLLKFTKNNGEFVTYEMYTDKIRRKVNGSGYEILLQDIRSVNFIVEKNGVTIICRDMENNQHSIRISALTDILVTS